MTSKYRELGIHPTLRRMLSAAVTLCAQIKWTAFVNASTVLLSSYIYPYCGTGFSSPERQMIIRLIDLFMNIVLNKEVCEFISALFREDVCIRCILRIMKVTEVRSYREKNLYVAFLMDVGSVLGDEKLLLQDYDFMNLKKRAQVRASAEPLSQFHSTLKEYWIKQPLHLIGDIDACSICVGIMQKIDDPTVFQKILGWLKEKDQEFDSFKFTVKCPVGINVRQLLIVNRVCHALGPASDFLTLVNNPHYAIDCKSAVKWILSAIFSETLNKRSDSHDDRFSIHLLFENLSDDMEQFLPFKHLIEQIEDELWHEKIQKKLKMNDQQLKAETHSKLLQKKHQAQQPFLPFASNLEKAYKIPSQQLLTIKPNSIPYPVKLGVTASYQNIFIKGNYIKLARYVSQTPWIIDGKQLYETSIQELLCGRVTQIFRPDSLKFHSGGREDIDVRMLGNGRPFVLELVDPRRNASVQTPETLKEVEEDIHKSSLIRVSGLGYTDQSCFMDLKNSEVNKIKAYCCVVKCAFKADEELVSNCNGLVNLKVSQKTPLRVLHRRTLMVRDKTIHKLKIKKINDNWLLVYVLSSAGTYIKEFIHGDLERTEPNLCQLLKNECDIFQLDVVKLYPEFNADSLKEFETIDEYCNSVLA